MIKNTKQFQRHPILISGAPRSGTTWVGKVLSTQPGIAYIHEPFNPLWNTKIRPGMLTVKLPYWFMYIDPTNEGEYIKSVSDVIELRYHPFRKIQFIHTVKDALRLLRDWSKFAVHRNKAHRPLIKDPIAVLSIEWLSDTFNMQPVLLMRNPVSFVGSMKKLGWRTDFKHLLQQERLMDLHLAPFRNPINQLSSCEHDVVDNAILLWNIIHYTILRYQHYHPDWLIMRHEDLAMSPDAQFRSICAYLDIDYSHSLQKHIIETTSSENPKEVSVPNRHNIFRNSRSSLDTWKNRLESTEVLRVKQKTADIFTQLYPEGY